MIYRSAVEPGLYVDLEKIPRGLAIRLNAQGQENFAFIEECLIQSGTETALFALLRTTSNAAGIGCGLNR
jgi:hypothetical protein